MPAAVDITDLVKRYRQTTAVDGLTFSAPLGAITAILGPNGAGKTTTVEICEGLRRADSGAVSVLGHPPGGRELHHRVGVMPQRPGAYPGARCGEMLRLVASYFADPLNPAALLTEVGLADATRTPARRLSGGQQQRLSLAMALVGRPELVFLDEPAAGLDVQARTGVTDLLRTLRRDGVSVILTTHDIDDAAELADHVVIVDHGAVLAAGTVAALTGGSIDQVRFRSRKSLPIKDFAAAWRDGATARETEPGHYVVQAAVTPDLVAAITAWTAGQGALADDVTTGGRSLEDVFLDLTGRGIRP